MTSLAWPSALSRACAERFFYRKAFRASSSPAFLVRFLLPLLIAVSASANPGPGDTEDGEDSGKKPGRLFKIDIRSIRDRDQVEISTEDGVTFVDIRLKDGIGSAGITLKEGTWPEKMSLRVHSPMLEKIAFVSSSGKRVDGFFTTSMNPETGERKHIFHSDQEVEAKRVELPKEKGGDRYFLLKIPKGFLDEGTSSLKVEWIDAYRR